MILVLNAGSSSLKVELFGAGLASLMSLSVSEIGRAGVMMVADVRQPVTAADHDAALALILTALEAEGYPLSAMVAAGHRVVHGAARSAPAVITPELMAEIEAALPLAPLHNPANLAGIAALARRAPKLRQSASFDTAFHATCPEIATTYAIPRALRDRGLRRYGFHGLSYASLVARLDPLPPRLLALHLGNGASLCAIMGGRSVATSMGYSPLEGLVMGTRSGSIDPGLVLRLAAEMGIAETEQMLLRESGLKGLAGTNDMKALLERSDEAARFAVASFGYWAARHAASAVAAMGGVDALVFTGGIGEHAAPVRDAIIERLGFLGAFEVMVMEADEERQIARDCAALFGL